MNFEYLNQMIKYIEDNLTEDIEYKKLAKIVGVSEYNLQRIFTFLTNISLSEYIRKRRLSKAFEELKTTDIKIIDLAIKYKYESDISFTRAFKRMFDITPSECRKNNSSYTLFPVIKFSRHNLNKEVNYEILELETEKEIYCLGVEDKNYDDFLYKIRMLYNKVKNTDLYIEMNNNQMYGISIIENNIYKYYLGSYKKIKNSKEIIIPKGKYIVFNVGSRNQQDIVEKYRIIYFEFIPSTSYKLNMNFSFELYENEDCFLYLPLE